jgi:hypothetical protein
MYSILAQKKGKGYAGMAGRSADLPFCRSHKDFVCFLELPAVLAGI